MPLPQPCRGLIIHYAYLWHDQYLRGREEGVKDRPCLVVRAKDQEGEMIVLVVPITHSPPQLPQYAVAIPSATKTRLGLDERPSWIVATEFNRFRWPGPDLRPVPGTPSGAFAYGVAPPGLVRQVALAMNRAAEHQHLSATPR